MYVIAKELGCSPAGVLLCLREMGIPSRPTGPQLRGRPCPPHVREATSKTHKGKIVSEETRRKASETRKKMHLPSPNWNGGRREGRTDGYIQVYRPNHPLATKDGYVMEHRLVMEQRLGRYLRLEEVVHHINHDTTDNRIENLALFPNIGEHTRWHLVNERWVNHVPK